MRAWQALGLVGLMIPAAGLVGCAGGDLGSGCAAELDVEPLQVAAGETITVTSDSVCDVSTPDGGWVLTVGHGDEEYLQASTDEDFDGTFRVEIPLPDDLPRGGWHVVVDNWRYDCGIGLCAAVEGGFIVH